jgi:ribosomal protein S18 acetylase RimI-like enzyme
MRIRELSEDDAAIYWPVRLRALCEDPDAFGTTYEESKDRPLEDVARQLREAREQGGFALGAFDDAGQLVGTVRLGREHGQRAKHVAGIYGMYTAPEVRGQGVGRALLEAAIARAREAPEIEQLFLNVVTTNAPALALYRRIGFQSFGTIPHAMKTDDGRYLDEEAMVYWLRQES